MKLKRKHRQLIVLGIGIVIIIFGLIQALFKLEISSKITDEVTFVLMVIAAALLFTKDKDSNGDNKIENTGNGKDNIDSGIDGGEGSGGNESNLNDITINEKESVNDK